MILWDRIQHYTVYRKMFFSYIALVFITVALISTLLFQLFSYSTAMEINDISKSMLTQTSYASDVIYDQVFSIGNELLHNNEIITAMFTKEADPVVEYTVIQKLVYIKTVYPFINNISLYNGFLSRYLNSNGVSMTIDAQIIKKIEKNNSEKSYEFFPMISDSSTKVLTFILYSNFSNLLPSNGALVISVDEQYIQKIIQGMSNNASDTVFVVNSDGIVLSHTSAQFFLQDFSTYPYLQKILHAGNKKGYLLETVGNRKDLITYVKSDRMGWIFISMKPYKLLLSNIYKLKNITLLLAFVLIIIGILLSVYLTGRIYTPLLTLVKKINHMFSSSCSGKNKYDEFALLSEAFSEAINKANSMEVSLKTALPVLHETYLNFLLKGNLDNLPQTSGIRTYVEEQLTGPYFSVCILKIDEYEKFEKANSAKDQALLHFAVSNIAQELIGKHCSNTAISFEKQHIAVLLQLKTGLLPENIYLALNETQNIAKAYFKLSVSIAIGNVADSKEGIHCSYTAALAYIQYKLFFGPQCVIDYPCLQSRLEFPGEYPVKVEGSLLEAIHLNHEAAMEKEISKFISSIGVMNYNHAVIYTQQLLLSILKRFDSSISAQDVNFDSYYKIIHSFSSIETLEELCGHIAGFCAEIASKLGHRRDNKNAEILAYIREYVQKNYSNPNLSIELIAEQVHLSSGYLGKIFKNTTHTSFGDYVNGVRLEKAKDLLLSTNEPSAVICEKVGLYNNTYFFTLFKKTFGVTPTHYRNQPPTLRS